MSNSAAGDKTILDHIHDLVSEEKALRSARSGTGMSEADRQRLKDLQGELDQAWDLLRQRRAREEYHEDPNQSVQRPVQNVTKYLQ